MRSFAVRESGLGFKFAVRFFVGRLDMKPECIGSGAAGINRKLLEKSGAAGWKLIRKPSQVGAYQLL